MGVEPFLLTSTLRLVVGQRLVRTLCPHCKRPRPATAEEQKVFAPVSVLTLFDAPGCEVCAGTGYHGRIGLFELMSLDDRLRALTLERAGSDRIEAAAREAGMMSLWEDGLSKVGKGLTTLAEVRRVVDMS
jgi:type II secretory ATPase GspE/PulE/Tfp pilus assembly ATPase PilB-like protein